MLVIAFSTTRVNRGTVYEVQEDELWAVFAQSPIAYAIAGLLGALWGSFANVCIYRMPPSDEHPKGRSVVRPGSHCFACGHPVRWYDNVPLVSWLWLKGRCRDCGTSFSPRYLLVEAITAMLFLASYHYVFGLAHPQAPIGEELLRFAIVAAFCFTLVVITFIDLDHQLILDKVTYPAIPIFYLLGLFLPGASWKTGLIGMAVGYGVVRVIADGFWLLTKREGMGYGDGKLLAIIGALWGWEAVLVSLFLGSLLGSVISIALLLVLGNPSTESTESTEMDAKEAPEAEPQESSSAMRIAVPFGPFLAAAALIYVFAQSYLPLRFFVPWR